MAIVNGALGRLQSLWTFRGFVIGSVRRDYQLRYRSTVLGFAWPLLQPLSMILVYALVFSRLMGSQSGLSTHPFAYSINLCAGIFAWNLHSELVLRSQSIFLDNANLIKKIRFPRLALPAIVVCTALLNFSIYLMLFGVFLLFTGNVPGWSALALIPLVCIQTLFSTGLGMTLAILNVFFRDLGQMTSMALQLWFWVTPIVYPISILPAALQPWMIWNPMYQLIRGYQSVLAQTAPPDWSALALVLLAACIVVLHAVRLFRRHAADMVDEL